MLAADPSDERSVQQLAAMLYTLGQWQLGVGRHTGAVSSLDEAEELYKRLGGKAAQLVTDVVIRRANVRAELGASLSAIEDAQQAVTASMAWGQQAPDARELDVARVLGIAASVQFRVRVDLDLACAAADWSVATYQERLAPGGVWSITPEHAYPLKSAAHVAAFAHTVAGRDEIAGPVRQLATKLTGGSWTAFDATVPREREERPTLARVLGSAGRDDLAVRITAAPGAMIGGLPLVPEMRAADQLLPVTAMELAGVQGGDLPARARMLLGLEAHAMFAAASRRQVPGMRYQFAEFGPPWARAVLAIARLMKEQGSRPAQAPAGLFSIQVWAALSPLRRHPYPRRPGLAGTRGR
jgi:hypothetical protein